MEINKHHDQNQLHNQNQHHDQNQRHADLPLFSLSGSTGQRPGMYAASNQGEHVVVISYARTQIMLKPG